MKSEKEKSGRFLIFIILFLFFISTAQGAWDNDDLMYAKGTSEMQKPVHNNDTTEDFENIQAAIDDPDTKDGHTILVDAGIYRERVVINKQLKLIGENKENTSIDGYGSGNCIKVTADNVEISGFTIQNGNYGIYLESSNCRITGNNIKSVNFDGIFLSNSVNNTIANNSISKVKKRGIRLSSSCNNRIRDNDLSENDKGISLSSSHNNTINHSRLTDNSDCGICLSFADNNKIRDNDLSGSEEGIILRGCNNNYIYHNNFIENRIQASDSSDTNRWDNGPRYGGNYWSDHKCTGNPSDGSQPYEISGGIMGATDFYPFMDEDGWLANLTVSILYPNGGESIPVGTQVPVSVHATDDTAVTNVTFFYSSNGGSNWNLIGAGIRVSGTDKDGIWNGTWNTKGLSVGTNYMIKAVASDGTLTIEDLSESTFSLCTLPSPPTLSDPGTNDNDGNYTVSWSSVSSATNYTLEEYTSSSFSSPTMIYSGSETTKEITGKSDGTYYYHVMARNACGWSDWSNIENITIDSIPPTVTITYPTSEQMFNTTTITVNGTASDNVKVSKVEVEVEPGSWQTASGTTLWNTSVTLETGRNTINASATDTSGNTKNTSVTVICDITPPVIYHENLSNATEGEPIPISATITDSTTKVASATLFYRIRDSEEAEISTPMDHVGDNYSATIPASHVTTAGVEYYIKAVDDVLNTAFSPPTAPEKPYSIAVTVINTSIVTIFTTSTINSSEIISGNIIPAHKANVTLTFNSTTCPIFERTTTSAISGCYHFLFPKHEEEKWNVSATWAGDSDTAGNTSKTVPFTVNEPEVNVGYAIIIAGRKDDHVYKSIDLSANNTYKVLLNLGFTHERIFYLNPRIEHDANNDGEYDVDKISSLGNIRYAINTWAQGNVRANIPLLIYMVGHSENNTFRVNGANENLTASDLNNYLDQLTDATGCHYITVVYEACHSGSFIDNLSRCGRIIVTSTGKYNDSLFLEGRGGAFSYSFFDNISIGKTIKDAFETASGSADIEKHNKDLNFSDSQTPWLDDNGDGKGNGINNKTKKLEDDGLLAAYKYIGSQIQNKNKIYNYKIRKGSYPEIPAIRLEGV